MARSKPQSDESDKASPETGSSTGGTMTVSAIETVTGDGPTDVIEDKAHDAEVDTGFTPDATEPDPVAELIEASHELYRAAEHILPSHQLARLWNALTSAKASRE